MPIPHSPSTRSAPISEEDGESFESIPWESLDRISRRPDQRLWYVVVGLVVVVGVVLAVMRGWSTPAPSAFGPEPSVPPVTMAAVTTTSTLPAIVTEADLMAIEPETLHRAAAAAAETAVVEFFSAESRGIWEGVEFEVARATFVEHATAMTVTPVGPARFEVVVAVSVLDAADSEVFVRRPLRGVSLVIDASDGSFRPRDLPTPAALPLAPFQGPATVAEPVDSHVMSVVERELADFGVVSEQPLSYGRLASGSVRVVAAVTEPGGTVWPMVVYVGPDGSVIPPGS